MAVTTASRLMLARRPRRLRRTDAIRRLVRETHLTPDCFVLPLFVCEGSGVRREVSSMPGVYQLSVDEAVKEAAAAKADGVPGVLLFGLPERKDAVGSLAADPEAPVQSAVREMKRDLPDLIVITDVCLCEYTSHGHCGILDGEEIVNDVTVVAPGAGGAVARGGRGRLRGALGHDGRPGRRDPAVARRARLRAASAIISYAAKYCSAFYGPFREAADSAPQFGDRRSHQMDPANVEEALREVETDLAEGADIIMVKPAMTYLDVIAKVKMRFNQPTAAYHVSGEYAMLKAASRERLDRRAAGDDGNAHRDPPRRRGHHHHLLRARGRVARCGPREESPFAAESSSSRPGRFFPAASTARSAPSRPSAAFRCSSSARPAPPSRTSTATASSTT